MSVAGSQSSFGSGIDSNAGSEALGPHGADDGPDETVNSFEYGVFGVLFTVSKEKAYNWWFVAFRLFMDWLQVFLLLVNPAYGWNINANNKLWQAFNFIQLNYFMSVRGYTFFLICMYVLAAALAANLGLCFWVANSFKNNSFNHVWPIVWLRYFSLVFYQVLDVASLTLFLMTMDCQYFSVDKADQGYNQEFDGVYCWTMPHMIHVVVAAVAIVIFFILAIVFTMAEIELNPASKNLMGIAHTKVEVWGFAIKMFMTCTSVFVTGVQWMSVFQLISAFLLCYLYLKWLPHLHAVINHIRVGCYFSVLWAALLLTIMAYHPGYYVHDDAGRAKQANAVSAALWALFIPMGLLGAGLSWWRTRYFSKVVVGKFREAAADVKARKIYRFSDPREVEIASRCCRVWLDEDTLDDAAVSLAERIIRAGVTLLPQHPYMAIWWASFLIDVQGSYQSGYTELQNAKKMPNPSFLERFCIFIRDQEHTQKASAATSGDNANVDLVSYVEFQRNYRLALHLHMDALVAKRTFWETLLHHNVTFNKVARAIERIDTTVRASERMYKQVLARHSNSVKVVALYVKFLQGVRNDPWSAARWAAEVEKMQRAEEEANERAVFGNAGAANGGLNNHDNSKGVIIMGANCLIRMINEPAASMFGYTNRNELVGKNINIIVPPPFSRNHNNYVRNYIQTGQAKILNMLREFVALHKDRYVVPINVYVTKVSGVGEDSVFMGIFSQAPAEPETATAWVLNSGMVLSCDAEFTDWLGYKHEDIHAKPMSDLAVDKQGIEDFLAKIKADQANSVKKNQHMSSLDEVHTVIKKIGSSSTAQEWVLKSAEFKHMYLDLVIPVEITVQVGGIGDTAMIVFRFKRRGKDSTPTLLVTDNKGRINHITSKLANRLGSSVSKLQAGGMMHALDYLLPAPYARVHHTWYREKSVDVPTMWSCRSGLSMCLNAISPEGPCMVPFSMNFWRKELPNRDAVNVVQMTERTHEQMLDERRLALTLNSKGIVVTASNSPSTLFGLEPDALVGCHLAYVIDILQPPLSNTHPTPGQVQADEDMATKMLINMAERSYGSPGVSWRVGVTAMMDTAALVALGPMGMTMIQKRTVPAVMVVEGYLEPPVLKGARVILPSEMLIKVELWRSDLLSGMLELDTQGNVMSVGMKDQPVFSPHLLLGAPSNMLTGATFGQIVPLHGKPLLEALFTEGALAPVKTGPGRGAGAGGRGNIRGGLRNGGQYTRRRGVGPVHTIKIQHGTDCGEVEMTVQAIVKQDIGTGCSLYILMHLVHPTIGRKDFRSWLWDSPGPGLTNGRARRSSALMTAELNSRSSILMNQPKLLSPGMAMVYGDVTPTPKKVVKEAAPKEPKIVQLPGAVMDDHPQHMDPIQHDMSPPRVQENVVNLDVADEVIRHTASPRHEPEEEPDMIPAYNQLPSLERDTEEPKPAMESPKQRPSRNLKAMESTKSGKAKAGKGTSVKSRPRSAARSAAATNVNDSDGDSVASDAPGLKEGGRERIANWMSSMPEPSQHGDSDDDMDSEEGEEEEEQAQQAAEEVDDEPDTAELDEAGAAMNDFKRGKRLKKLAKILLGPQAQAPNLRLKYASFAIVLILIVVDLAMFMTFMQLINVQSSQVNDLRSSSKAVNRVMRISQSTAHLGILLAGFGQPDLFHLGAGGTQTDITYNLQVLEGEVAQMEEFHHGIYRGFGKLRQLPTAFNLRAIWEQPILPVKVYYEQDNVTFGEEQDMGLWDAGNLYIKSARNILQNLERYYGLSTGNSQRFVNNTDSLFILYNGPRSLMTYYQATLDGLMQQAILDSRKMNDIQLVILAIEGGFVGITSVILMWFFTSKMVFRRYAVFSIFMTVPSGVIRGLATVAFNLEEGSEEDEAHDANQEEAEQGEGGHNGTQQGGGDLENGSGRAKGVVVTTKLNMGAKQGNQDELPKQGFFARMGSALAFWKPSAVAGASYRRRLQPSWTAVLWLSWPFMFWAVFVIIINVMGYLKLKNMSEPIAISNVVQFMSIRANRVLLYSTRLTSEQYFHPSGNFTAPYLPQNAYNPFKVTYRTNLKKDYADLRLEYEAMLYGHGSAEVANQTSPHFALAKNGIMFSNGADLMYLPQGCMALHKVDCQPADSPFYRFTMNGLDQMLKEYFWNIESLLLQPDNVTDMTSEFYRYIYEVGIEDIQGGLVSLTDVYTQQVQGAYLSALNLHIVAFAMCVGLGLVFLVAIMRPTINRITHESKRVAELLASLPPEMNAEVTLQEALHIRDSQAAASNKGLAESQRAAEGSLANGSGRFSRPAKSGNGSILSDGGNPRSSMEKIKAIM